LCVSIHSFSIKDFENLAEIKGLPIINEMKEYQIGEWMSFGDIKVKPMVVDHSALDAFMFLIESNGKRILFTGDYREHGAVGSNGGLENMINQHIVNEVDILITEGTMLSRITESTIQIKTEEELGKKAYEILNRKENKYNFVIVSSTNLDSVMNFYHNTPNNKAFVCDEYQAQLMQIAMEDKGDDYDLYKPAYIRKIKRNIYIWGKQKELRREDGFYGADYEKMREKGFVMLVRVNKNPNFNNNKFEKALNLFEDEDPMILYSMWEGYLKGKHKDESIVNFIGNYRKEHLHTSGHAYVENIKKVIKMVNPKVIIPMHTECADEFTNIEEFNMYSDRVVVLNDGQIFEV